MKVLHYTQPVHREDAVVAEEEILPFFYQFMHQHKELQVSLILRGEGTLVVGNYAQPFKPGDLYLIGPNQPHVFKSTPAHFSQPGDYNCHVIHLFFDPERIPTGFFQLPELDSIRNFLQKMNPGLQMPDKYIPSVSAIMKTAGDQRNLKRLFSLLELLQFCSTEVAGWKTLSTGFEQFGESRVPDGRMNQVVRYTHENYARNITLEQIASIANMTPHAFCKYFKQHTRKTYNAFLNEIRIREACKQIIHGQFDGIATIAFHSGYNSVINFNRVFKKVTGMSPSDYKKANQT